VALLALLAATLRQSPAIPRLATPAFPRSTYAVRARASAILLIRMLVSVVETPGVTTYNYLVFVSSPLDRALYYACAGTLILSVVSGIVHLFGEVCNNAYHRYRCFKSDRKWAEYARKHGVPDGRR